MSEAGKPVAVPDEFAWRQTPKSNDLCSIIVIKLVCKKMELYAKDMFFRGDAEKEQVYDCCIHGIVVFKIGDTSLSDDTEWWCKCIRISILTHSF